MSLHEALAVSLLFFLLFFFICACNEIRIKQCYTETGSSLAVSILNRNSRIFQKVSIWHGKANLGKSHSDFCYEVILLLPRELF